ncbi:MAG: prepilin-type N-terminal cleavage/methylation domain-containing protein [Nitrospirae bacterium]|nr:MAG: prepilin-type N-terminal cleavage/methylation domain-containing protein [Nitrospirota bacterium]
MRHELWHGQHGFTLPELLLALALSMVTLSAIYAVHVMLVRQQLVLEAQVAMQQDVRAALSMMTQELRLAGYDPRGVNRDKDSSNDFNGLPLDPIELQIQADLNGNGIPRETHEFIAYLFDEPTFTLRRRTGRGGRQPVVDRIQGFVIRLLDQRGEPTRHPTRIRLIEVTLTANPRQGDRTSALLPHLGGRQLTLRTRVRPRNLSVEW